jgi:hypothetical protein
MSKLDCEALLQVMEETGAVNLSDLKKLSLKDLEEFFDELRTWCIYSNGDKKKLKKKKK